jgi:hypothetical protein
MKKIRLTCSWCNDETLYNRFQRVYISKLNANSEYQFTLDNNFDYLVIINGPRYNINHPKDKTIGVIMEPYNSPTTKLYRPYLEQICKHIIWHYKVNSSQYIFYPGLLPFHMDYDTGNNLDYYLNNKFLKTKLCSYVVSFNENNSFETSIYKQRVDFAKKILATDLDIDIYGNSWEQSGIKDSRLKGHISNKRDGLLNYKYSIGIENCIEQGYFTEKLTDCILTNTIPIYYGCPDVNNYFPNILTLTDLNDTIQLTSLLKENYTIDKTPLVSKYNFYTALTKYLQQCP